MKAILREPLLHFLVLALGLFVLHDAVVHEDLDDDERTIVVDRQALLTFIQYRTKAFEPEAAARILAGLSNDELEKVIADYVREEALARQARKLNLDRDDYVIKRRLIQKVEYIARGFADQAAAMSDEDLQTYFDANRADFYVSPRITFTHVFFSAERDGSDVAARRAEALLADLRASGARFEDAPKFGDRFLYGVNFVDRTDAFISDQFGPEMTAQLFDVVRPLGEWLGPVQSRYGAHLVMIRELEAGRNPELEEVIGRVRQQASRARADEQVRDATQQIVDAFEADVRYRGADDE